MKYKAILNNYMIGHYGKGCFRDMIVKQTRIDRNHTEVIMEIPNEHFYWVQHLIGTKRLVALTQYEDSVHNQDERITMHLKDLDKVLNEEIK